MALKRGVIEYCIMEEQS